MKKISVLTTGGTIAMRAAAGTAGAVPALRGTDFANSLPEGMAELGFTEFANLPSAHLTIPQLWDLSRRVASLTAQDNVDGVIVTHGTDTMEESAYLCEITIQTEKPVVFTGAMRTASDVGYEGQANLAAAVRVASSDQARGLGTLIVMNDQIFSAQDVTKTHTTGLDTFRSPEWGPLGSVDYDGLVIARAPSQRVFIPATGLEPDVHLLKLTVGMGTELIDFLVDAGARGIVIECLGGGRVPPWWLPSIQTAISRRIAIVVTSRVGTGRTVDRYGYPGAHADLERLGCWFAYGLNGQKARIKAMVALGTDDPRQYFQ